MSSRTTGTTACAVAALTCLTIGGCSDPTVDLDSPDADKKIEALRRCARQPDDEVVERVAEVVSHRDTMVAAEAVRSLGRMGHPKAVDVLKEVAGVGKHRHSALRREAVIQLGRQREAREEVLPVLRQCLKEDADPRVRAAAALSISRQRSLVDAPLLMETAETEPDPVVQTRAVRAVERLVGMRFRYDPTAPKAQRDAALRRMRRVATRVAANLKRWREHRKNKAP